MLKMICKFNYIICTIIIVVNIKSIKSFNVNFDYHYNLQVEPFNTQIYKRELTQYFDKASFSLNGFEKVESIPVLFPIDICVFHLEGSKYATTLHMKRNGARHFEVLKMNNGSYDLIADIPTPNGIAMDCINFNNKGYVAIALNLTEPVKYAKNGSPIYEIDGNRIRAVQFFAALNLMSIYLRTSGNDFFLLHTYANSQDTPNLHCPYFKWSGSTFNKMGRIPCSNARQLAPFSIDYESYVAVANYADQKGRTNTNSEIYKYSRDKKKFVLFQKIRTNGAVDVQYFNVPQNEVRRQHFLVFGNSISTASVAKKEKAKREGKNLEADSIFYLFDKGQFIPYQKLSLYAVQKFLPVQNVEAEKFILLVACTDQDIKIYNLNDWKFEESKVQFTEGALSKGVSNMRIYQEKEKSYLIIANELMVENETNIFLPIFEQEERANALRQQIIDWAKSETQRLETINIKELRKRVEEKLRNLEKVRYLPKIQEIPQANIQTVTTASLVYPKLKMSSNYWSALNYANQALDTLETMLKQKQRLKRDTSYDNLEYVYETLNVNTLTLKKNLKAKQVNRVNIAKLEFENIKAKKVLVSDKFTKPTQGRVNPNESLDYSEENEFMSVKNLQITGKLNEYLWSELLNNTLKRKEDIQFLKASVQMETLKTDNIIVNNDKVNEQNLGALIPTNGGNFVINQDIQFAEPITANKVEIFERLNNIHVFNGQFDVLLKKSNKTQVIEGLKNVTNITVLEPITIAGKMMGHQLESISPNKFIQEPLVLQGNFMINGDVHINHHLNTLDLIDLKEKLSAKQVLDMGIRMDKSLKDANLKFLQPLRANNSLLSFVNQHDLQSLVKLNVNDIQVIEGTKIFNDSLIIKRGFSEVKNLNGVDMEKLESNAFLKNNNQTIKVPMKIGRIFAKSIQSPVILLNNKNHTDYLTITGNQSIQGSLIIENLKTQFMTVEHLNTDSKIFKQNLHDIYQQKSRNAPEKEVFQQNTKFHGSIYVKNLILNSTINNKTVVDIEKQLLQLEGNIKYVGNYKFNYPMIITNLTFKGKLNGIKAEEFGNSWLQKKAAKQEFRTEQTFATMNVEQGIQLQGKINGFNVEDFYTKTYWINRDEHVYCGNFESPLEITGYLTTNFLNGYMIPQDVFNKSTKEVPLILSSMTVKENLEVDGNILNLTSINNLNLYKLQEFLYDSQSETLYVENAYFSNSPPLYKTLNNHYVRKTLDSVWLANENVVLPHHVEIIDAFFEGLLEFKGPLNNINLDYVNEHYFSKTRPQEVSIEIVFSKGAEFKNKININELQVFGPIIEETSRNSINFNEFVLNTLKTSGPHIISGNWTLQEAKVEGNLNGALINQLNLVDDILHTVKPDQVYYIEAPKVFKQVHIKNLYADSITTVNKIPVANWIKDAVYLYENCTIKGLTSIDFLNVYNNLKVQGKLNNITFNEHNLLTQNKDQHILGNVKIISHLGAQKRFLTNNIEHLYTDFINDQYIPAFMENLVPASAAIEIKGHLSFKQALKLEKYEGPEGFLAQNQWSKRNIYEHAQIDRTNLQRTDKIINEFSSIRNDLSNITKNQFYKLDHFNILQTFEINSADIVILSLQFDNVIFDILAVFNMEDKNVTIYKWIPEQKEFRETKDFNWLPQDFLMLKVIKKRFEKLQQPIPVEHLKMFISQDVKSFYNVLFTTKNLYKNYEFLNNSCIQFLNNLSKSVELKTFCSNSQNPANIMKFDFKVQQFIGLRKNSIALLTNSSVLVYDTSSTNFLQKLPTTKPVQIAFGSFKDKEFLAILSNGQTKTLNHGFVDIYRSVNSTAYTLFQSLDCLDPANIRFSFVEKSNDFLMHVLTGSSNKPYLIYQYRGVMGFQKILSDSVLAPNFEDLNILNLYSSKQHLVALMAKKKFTLIELVSIQI